MNQTVTLSRSRLTRQRIAELRLKCQSQPDSIAIHKEAIREFLEAGLEVEALPLLRRLCDLRPNDIEMAAQLAAVLASRGDDAGALEQCRRVASLCPDSIEAQHNLGVAACKASDYQTARTAFTRKLELDPSNYETLNDLAVIHTITQNPEDAARAYLRCLEINPHYEKARDNAFQFFWENGRFGEGASLVEQIIQKTGSDAALNHWRRRFANGAESATVAGTLPDGNAKSAPRPAVRVAGKKLAFVASSDAFLGTIMSHFRRSNDVRIFTGRSHEELAELLRWADLTWFEWCDTLAIQASRLPRSGKAVCRLHSYEAFTDAPTSMNWAGIDRLILVNKSVGEILDMGNPLPVQRTVIHNGVDPQSFPFVPRPRRGKKIASVGYINYKKNPSLLLQAFKAIHDWDPEYELHIAGEHQDPRIKLYFDNLLPRLNLPVTFHGWVKDMPSFYAQMDYVISTSLFESFHYSVAEGMLSGCLPLVHSWKGADQLYPSRCIFDTQDQAVKIIQDYLAGDTEQIARAHRDFIIERYNWSDKLNEIDTLLADIFEGRKEPPRRRRNLAAAVVPKPAGSADHGLVSIIIIAANDGAHVKDAVATALSQTYRNTEVIVCDDGSTDDTESQLTAFSGNIKVIRQIRRGLAGALNTAIQHCHGAFIAPLLGSEAFAPDKLEKQIAQLASDTSLLMVSCGTEEVEESTSTAPATFDSALAQLRGNDPRKDAARTPVSSVVFRRSLLAETGWFDECDPDLNPSANPICTLRQRVMSLHGPQSVGTLSEPLVYIHSEEVGKPCDLHDKELVNGTTDRWTATARAVIDRTHLSQPVLAPKCPDKSGARIVFVGAVDPGGQMAMWASAINKYTAHTARVLTHSESMAYPSDLVLKRRDHGKAGDGVHQSAMKTIAEAERVAADADLIIFATGVAPGSLRRDAKLCDSDEQDFGTIHWPALKGSRQRAALLFGTPSVNANLGWYRNRLAAKGWPVLTCDPDVHAQLAEALYLPRLLNGIPVTSGAATRADIAVGIVYSGDLDAADGGTMIRDVAAALKEKFPHVAFGRYQDLSWPDVLDMKRHAHLGVDCIAVGRGGFTSTSLENSALGLLNIVYCNRYTRGLIAQTLGTDRLPWEIPATPEELRIVFEKYLADPALLRSRMRETREWFETYWCEQRIATRIAHVLDGLLEKSAVRQSEFKS